MSKRVGNAFADYELIRSTQVCMRDIERLGYVVQVAIYDTRQLGVLEIDCWAMALGSAEDERPVCRYRMQWPNGRVVSFAAQLFQSMTKLATLLPENNEMPF